MEPMPAETSWKQYVQLMKVDEAFRVLKSELNIRLVWHRTGPRVEAHVMVAFLGYSLWVCLKNKLQSVAGSLAPSRAVEVMGQMMMVDVWFDLQVARKFCLPWYAHPEADQALLLPHLKWELPSHPPPKSMQRTWVRDLNVWSTMRPPHPTIHY